MAAAPQPEQVEPIDWIEQADLANHDEPKLRAIYAAAEEQGAVQADLDYIRNQAGES
jgi:hypothetical protein